MLSNKIKSYSDSDFGGATTYFTSYTQNIAEISNRNIEMAKVNLPSYDHNLITLLAEEHRQIRLIYNQIMSATMDKQYAQVGDKLLEFQNLIRSHYQNADAKLYLYIYACLRLKYPEREKSFNQLMLEMKNISAGIFHILTDSHNMNVSGSTYSEFMSDFLRIGKMMNKRIIKEETVLFKVYQCVNE